MQSGCRRTSYAEDAKGRQPFPQFILNDILQLVLCLLIYFTSLDTLCDLAKICMGIRVFAMFLTVLREPPTKGIFFLLRTSSLIITFPQAPPIDRCPSSDDIQVHPRLYTTTTYMQTQAGNTKTVPGAGPILVLAACLASLVSLAVLFCSGPLLMSIPITDCASHLHTSLLSGLV